MPENAQNQDELPVPDTSKTKVGSEPHASIKTSPVASVISQAAGDVMTRFHILKCRDDEAKLRDAENSGTLSDFKVSVEQDMVEKDKKQPAVPYIKDMDFPFPTSKNESGPALPPASPTLSWSNHVDDDVMSRFQVLKSRDECISCVPGKVSSNSNNIDEVVAAKRDTDAIGVSMKHHPVADNDGKDVDNLDASVMARLDVLRSRGNNISSTAAGEQLEEVEVAYQYDGASKRDYWSRMRGGLSVEMEPPPGVSAKDNLTRNGKERRRHVEGKHLGGGSDGSSSDWEHVLWG